MWGGTPSTFLRRREALVDYISRKGTFRVSRRGEEALAERWRNCGEGECLRTAAKEKEACDGCDPQRLGGEGEPLLVRAREKSDALTQEHRRRKRTVSLSPARARKKALAASIPKKKEKKFDPSDKKEEREKGKILRNTAINRQLQPRLSKKGGRVPCRRGGEKRLRSKDSERKG